MNEILLSILLIVSIFAVGYLVVLMRDLRRTLAKVEETRAGVTGAVKRLETVADSTEKLLREEVAPTLQVARETLANVEVTTRALADTTLAARRVSERVDTLINSQQLLAAGGVVGKLVAHKAADALGGVARGVGNGLLSLLGRRKKKAVPNDSETSAKALPASETMPRLKAPEASDSRAVVKVKDNAKVPSLK